MHTAWTGITKKKGEKKNPVIHSPSHFITAKYFQIKF